MSIIIRDLVKSFNLGQTMDDEQVADLIEDFRLCFNNAKNGRYDKGIFRLDASVVLSWLDKYTTDRLNAADEGSYNSHLSTKGEISKPDFEKYYDRLKR